MNMLKGNAIVGQSGGPTSAINATLAGVIRGALEHKDVIEKIYGMRNGIEGFLEERRIFRGKYRDSAISTIKNRLSQAFRLR